MKLVENFYFEFDDSDFDIELEKFLKKILEEFCNKFNPFSFFYV